MKRRTAALRKLIAQADDALSQGDKELAAWHLGALRIDAQILERDLITEAWREAKEKGK